MKILIVSLRFYPEPFRSTEIAESLVALGHDVTVLCGLPNVCSNGIVPEEYRHGKNRYQEHNGVKIIRAKEIGRRNNIFFRFLNYYSFPHYANKIVKKLDNDFDVVLVIELSPIMMCIPGIKYAKKNNKKLVMYEMDLWPESLLAGGITHKSLLYKYYKKVSGKIYSKFDKILASTKEHIDYIKALPNCSELDIDYLPQYAESIFENSNYKTEDNGVIDLMFAGNIGKAQSVDTIIKAASILKDNPKYMFHIVGSGSELDNIKALSKELGTDNVIFYGQKPLSEMPELYKIADVMLVTLEDKPYANMTIPGKVQSYMAVGKPIIGSINGSASSFIKDNNIGYTCNAEDSNALAELIKSLSINEIKKIGEHAREVYLSKYRKELFINSIVSELEKNSK